MNDPRSNEFTHPEGNESMSAPQSTDILAERIRFDIIAKTESGHELRVWTDGHDVRWQDDEGQEGRMPAMLFRLAAMSLARRCEEDAIEAGEDGDNFFNMVHDSIRTPVELAMAHPYWAQPDDERNDLRFGFKAVAVNTSIDAQPDGLKPRDGLADDRCKQCGKRCPNATCPACQEANARAVNVEPAPGVDAFTKDGRFISGTGYGGERR